MSLQFVWDFEKPLGCLLFKVFELWRKLALVLKHLIQSVPIFGPFLIEQCHIFDPNLFPKHMLLSATLASRAVKTGFLRKQKKKKRCRLTTIATTAQIWAQVSDDTSKNPKFPMLDIKIWTFRAPFCLPRQPLRGSVGSQLGHGLRIRTSGPGNLSPEKVHPWTTIFVSEPKKSERNQPSLTV